MYTISSAVCEVAAITVMKTAVFLPYCIDYEWKTCVMHACPGSTVNRLCVCVCVCVWECVSVCSVAATTPCVSVLFGAAAASSSAQGWEKQRCLCLGPCAYTRARQGWQGPLRGLPNWTEPHHSPPIGPPLSWTLEASIPPSALALIITKDRMHKTWRTLRQRRPRSPFSPHAEPWNNTWAPLACDSDDTHAVFLSSPISLSSSSSSSMLLCSVEW